MLHLTKYPREDVRLTTRDKIRTGVTFAGFRRSQDRSRINAVINHANFKRGCAHLKELHALVARLNLPAFPPRVPVYLCPVSHDDNDENEGVVMKTLSFLPANFRMKFVHIIGDNVPQNCVRLLSQSRHPRTRNINLNIPGNKRNRIIITDGRSRANVHDRRPRSR